MTRPFRFGVQCTIARSRREWREKAQRIEALGYQTFFVCDHFGEQLSPVPALLSAAEAAPALRVGTLVFANDFRHPVELAKQTATLDLLCRTSLRRVGPVGTPAPTRSGGPPLLIGGGGPRILRFAGREAEIVGIVPRARADGAGLDLGDFTHEALAQKVGWVREGAGARFDSLELSTLIQAVVVTDDRVGAAAQLAAVHGMERDILLDSPYLLIGTDAEIEAQLRALRDRFGVSYFALFERDAERFAPIARALAGA